MGNILSLAKRDHVDFSLRPFSETDGLIFSWFSYYKFPQKFEEGIPLSELKGENVFADGEMYRDCFLRAKSKRFFKALCRNPRFKDVLISDFDLVERQRERFSATCFTLPTGELVMVFRGTDPSFDCWREIFGLAYREEIPSQKYAKLYFDRILKKYPNKNFYVCGYSKGGNLASYVTLNAAEDQRSRILGLYCYDSPALQTETAYPCPSFSVKKYVPQSSFVGMLFEKTQNFTVIKSASLSLLQHVPFSWVIKDGTFLLAKKRTKSSVRLERAFNRWVKELPIEHRERFVDLIYNALDRLKTHDFNVVLSTMPVQMLNLLGIYMALPKEERSFFCDTVKQLLRNYVRERAV